MSPYRDPFSSHRFCAVCGASGRSHRLYTPVEVGALLCMTCVLSPVIADVLVAVKCERVSTFGAEVLLDYRSARQTEFLRRFAQVCVALVEWFDGR